MQARLFNHSVAEKARVLAQLTDNDNPIYTRMTLQELDAMVREYILDPATKQEFYVALKDIENDMLEMMTKSDEAQFTITFDELNEYLGKAFGIAGYINSMVMYTAILKTDYELAIHCVTEYKALEKTLKQSPHSDALTLINLQSGPKVTFEEGRLFFICGTQDEVADSDQDLDNVKVEFVNDKMSIETWAQLLQCHATAGSSEKLNRSINDKLSEDEYAQLTPEEKMAYDLLDKLLKEDQLDLSDIKLPDIDGLLQEIDQEADQLLEQIKTDQAQWLQSDLQRTPPSPSL